MENNIIEILENAFRTDKERQFVTSDFIYLVKTLANTEITPSETLEMLEKKPEIIDKIIKLGFDIGMFEENENNLSIVVSKHGHDALLKLVVLNNFLNILGVCDDEYWQNIIKHCIATAFIAETLAETAFAKIKNKVFLAGLLHDAGKLILFRYAPDVFKQIQDINNKDENKRLISNEAAVMDINHQKIGQHFLDKWFFPKYVYNVAGNHHYVDRETPNRQEAAIIQAANSIAKAMELGKSDNYYVDPVPKWIWNSLQVREYNFKEVFEAIYEKIDNLKLTYPDIF